MDAKAFFACVTLAFSMGVLAGVQFKENELHRSAMRKATEPVNCLRDVPRTVFARGE